MNARPVVFVTRKLPDAVTARLSGAYQAQLNPEDRVPAMAEVIAGAAGADALLVCPTDKLTAEALEAPPVGRMRANRSSDRTPGTPGARPTCWACMSPASGSGASAWAGSARRSPSERAP